MKKNTITKEFLEKSKQEGKTLKSLQEITGLCDSTLSYHAKKHGVIFDNPRGSNINNLKDQIFGKLKVIEQAKKHDKKTRRAVWLCQCECGNKVCVIGTSLLKKLTTSCGCNRINKPWKGFGEISGAYWSAIKAAAKDRNLIFEIDIEYCWDLFLIQNRKCALSNMELFFVRNYWRSADQTASLDRIDSSKGYIKGNVQWVHKSVNKMKWDFDQKLFIEICCLIADYNRGENNEVGTSC